jgi:hypothetical protein
MSFSAGRRPRAAGLEPESAISLANPVLDQRYGVLMLHAALSLKSPCRSLITTKSSKSPAK